MKVERTERGFERIEVLEYANAPTKMVRLVQQSSAALVELYYDALDRPGTSALWIGDNHLNREQVRELIGHLQSWLDTGSLEVKRRPKRIRGRRVVR